MNTCPTCHQPVPEHRKTYPILDRHPEGVSYAVRSGEFRAPRKGEFYISGAIPAAYRAPNDLTMKFQIARLV